MRLKLIYALGAISRTEYEDIELLLALHNQLALDRQTYRFTDDEVLGPLSMLHGMRHLPPPPHCIFLRMWSTPA
ncbi:Mannitol repressor protein [Edwardsiella tarda]|nr:Mannitol repressor protein [Edwardsiella tarda]